MGWRSTLDPKFDSLNSDLGLGSYILSPHPSLQHLPQMELGSERALARRKHPWDGGGRSRNDDNA